MTTTPPPKDMIEMAHRMADAAGDTIRRYFTQSAKVEIKGDASPVTEADRVAEEIMRGIIQKHFPAHGIIGEEFGRHNEDAEYVWILDPIDGTRSFIAGYPVFTTLIALLCDGVPVIGMVDQPILYERWTAVLGSDVIRNGSPVTVRETSKSGLVIATTSLDYFSAPQSKAFAVVKKKAATVLYGGDAYAYAMLASGRVDAVIDASMKPYDYAALIPLVEGAGGMISDWQGKALGFDSESNVLATTSKKLHKAMMEVLADVG